MCTLFIDALAKILKNIAKFIQKLNPGFKNQMRNLDNSRQTVESPESWNLMEYFCPRNTFVQKIHSFSENKLLVSKFTKIHMSFLKP